MRRTYRTLNDCEMQRNAEVGLFTRPSELMIGAIKGSLKKKNGKISLPGFGTFSKVRRKARKGVNPKTGEKINIEARNAVKFQPAKALKEAV